MNSQLSSLELVSRLSRVDRYEDPMNPRGFVPCIKFDAKIQLALPQQQDVLVADEIVTLVSKTTVDGLPWKFRDS